MLLLWQQLMAVCIVKLCTNLQYCQDCCGVEQQYTAQSSWYLRT